MAIDAIVRVSFQSATRANQAANSALVGHLQNATGTGPFRRINTAVYQCSGAPDAEVGKSLALLGEALQTFSARIDFLSITMVRTS